MSPRKKAPVVPVVAVPASNPVPDEDWKVVQVASHMGLSYQTARNQMLSGVFGASKFNAEKRCLTVSANRVKSVKTLRDKPKSKRRKRTA